MCHMTCHSVVQEMHRVLALAELLHLTVIIPICCSTGQKIMFTGSRATHPAESRFAPIEGEALALVYGLESTCHFVIGLSI